MKQGFTVLSTY